MTAPRVAPPVRIPAPHDIATNPIYTCGTWRDAATGRNLIAFLAHHVGPSEARRILDEAAGIAAGQRRAAAPPRQPAPLAGHDLVWSVDGVDHDPIPLRQVTVCGLLIPPPFVYERAGAAPCLDCYDGDVR